MAERTSTASANGAVGDESRIRVLMYHRVLPTGVEGDPHQLWISEKLFRCQLQFLARRGFTPITFNEYWECREEKRRLPRRPIVLTFDDAFSETYSIVFPTLKEFGMKAVIFAVADPDVRDSSWDSKHPGAVTPLMSEEQLIEMHAAGFEIGSHTLHHADLPGLPVEEAWAEISRSRMVLETLLNAPVRSFAYPFGRLNTAVKDMVRDAGYTIAVSAWTGPALFGGDLLEVRRIIVLDGSRWPITNFAVSLMAPYQYGRWMWWRIREHWEERGWNL